MTSLGLCLLCMAGILVYDASRVCKPPVRRQVLLFVAVVLAFGGACAVFVGMVNAQ